MAAPAAQGHGHSHSHGHGHSHHHPGEGLPDCTLEKAMEIMVGIYHEFAPKDDKDDCLSQRDMTDLLKSQAPTFLAACNRNSPNYIPQLFKRADVDKNKKLTFEEFLVVFGLLANDAHLISHNEDRCHPEKN